MFTISDYDKNPNNFLKDIAELKRRLSEIERWASPAGKRLLPNPPSIEAWSTSAQTISNSTPTVVDPLTDYTNEDGLELESGHIIKLRRESTNEWYDIWVHAQWEANSTGYRALGFALRDADTGVWALLTPEIRNAIASPDVTYTPLSVRFQVGNSDAIRIVATQNSGGDLDLQVCLVNVIMLKSGDVAAQ